MWKSNGKKDKRLEESHKTTHTCLKRVTKSQSLMKKARKSDKLVQNIM